MKKYIKSENLPPRFGFASLAVWLLVAERFSAPGWVYGVIVTLYGVAAIGTIMQIHKGTAVDIFEGK